MKWQIAQAKQEFSQLVRAAFGEPQFIFNRNRLVAALIDGEEYEAFRRWKEERERSLADVFLELQEICAEEAYSLDVPERKDRSAAPAWSDAGSTR